MFLATSFFSTIRQKRTRVVVYLIAICSLLTFTACGEKSDQTTSAESATAGSEKSKPKVALIMKSLANEFFVRMGEGARDHHEQHADQYDLVVNGIKDESDLTQQVMLVEQMVASGADVIVIAPADSKALVPVLKRASKNGVVIVNIDNKLDADILKQAGLSVPFVGPDNREGARLVGEYLVKQLGAGDEVAIIGGIPTAFNAQQRQLGFEDAMSAANLKVVSVQNGDWMQAKASTITAALVTEYPSLKAILCANDSMAIGAAAALKQTGKSETIKIVGFDNLKAAQELVRNGRMLATAEQYGDKLAVFGIEYALQILQGGKPEDKKTPVDLVTVETLTP